MRVIMGKLRLRAQALRRAQVSPPRLYARSVSDRDLEEIAKDYQPGPIHWSPCPPFDPRNIIPLTIPVWRTIRSPLRRGHG